MISRNCKLYFTRYFIQIVNYLLIIYEIVTLIQHFEHSNYYWVKILNLIYGVITIFIIVCSPEALIFVYANLIIIVFIFINLLYEYNNIPNYYFYTVFCWRMFELFLFLFYKQLNILNIFNYDDINDNSENSQLLVFEFRN